MTDGNVSKRFSVRAERVKQRRKIELRLIRHAKHSFPGSLKDDDENKMEVARRHHGNVIRPPQGKTLPPLHKAGKVRKEPVVVLDNVSSHCTQACQPTTCHRSDSFSMETWIED